MPEPEDLRLLNAKQVADLIQRHPRHVMKMAQRGEIPSIKFGLHGLRFRPADLDAWIEQHRAT